jgi:POT family proton-dependent oligopeptide transporter
MKAKCAMQQTVQAKFNGREFWGHPSGLYVLFLTEMWERFSYYGMRSLLILYMTDYLLTDPERAAAVFGYKTLETFLVSIFGKMTVQQMGSQLYGLYTGFVYFTPFFGGLLADRYLGKYRSVFLGGTLMALGHFLMASETAFFAALVFIILGYGFFKPNLSPQVGSLYKEGDSRMDGAFAIYYMGVNLGAFFSPLICGTLGQKVGWHWGFGAAGVGMILSMIIYWAGSGLIPASQQTLPKAKTDTTQKMSRQDWNAVFGLAFLCFLNIVFWAVYEQQGNTLQLWADKKTDWFIAGWELPSTWFQSFNPAMIFIFSPLLVYIWNWQARKNSEPSSITKMGIGCVLCGLAYVFMILAAQLVPGDEKGSVFWLMATTFIFTVGEIYLSPIGLSLVTRVSPKPIVSTMMGLWFMSSFFGNYLTGYLGTFYETMPKEQFFMMLCGLGVGAGVIFFMVARPLQKAIGSRA